MNESHLRYDKNGHKQKQKMISDFMEWMMVLISILGIKATVSVLDSDSFQKIDAYKKYASLIHTSDSAWASFEMLKYLIDWKVVKLKMAKETTSRITMRRKEKRIRH